MSSFSESFPDVNVALIEAVTSAVWQRNARRLPGGEVRFTCPDPSHHSNGDANPSARWCPARGIWFCDVGSVGGGTRDLAERLGVESASEIAYAIRDITGTIVALHIRVDRPDGTKSCYWRRPTGESGLDGMPLETLPLYGTERLATATPGMQVTVTEGERCADHLVARNVLAVGTVTGAGAIPSGRVLEVLRGFDVVLWTDADADGRTHMRRIAAQLRTLGIGCRLLDPWSQKTGGEDAADFVGTDAELEALLATATVPPTGGGVAGPWTRAITAAAFIAQQEPELAWLEPRLLAPGAITEWFSPRGLGKTQVGLAIAIKLARRGRRVLLLDRDNPRHEVRRRLRSWGAAGLETLKVMTRDDVPSLTDREAWKTFPLDYELVILDSLDAATEGVGEKDSEKPSKAIAVLLDIVRRVEGPGLLVLGNTIKSGTHGRGSGIVEDRADISYEVRDATDLQPTGTKPWWVELPPAGRDSWAERATRRQQRSRYVLAFVPSKFRLGEEPTPFCLEVDHETTPWSLTEVTAEIVAKAEAASQTAADRRVQQQQAAVDRLAAEVQRRAAEHAEPLTRTAAVDLLRAKDGGVSREAARTLLDREDGRQWRLVEDKARHGHPVLVLGVDQPWPAARSDDTPTEPEGANKQDPPQEDIASATSANRGLGDPPLAAAHGPQGPQEDVPSEAHGAQGVPSPPLLAADPPDSPPAASKPRLRTVVL